MVVSPPKQFADSVSTAICCDDGSCLCVVENNLVSLPNSRVQTNTIWKEQCIKDVKELTGVDVNVGLINVYRIYKMWLPPGQFASYICHCIYSVFVNTDFKKKSKPASGKFAQRVKWINEAELQRLFQQEQVCFPALVELYPRIGSDKGSEYRLNPPDIFTSNVLTEVSDRSFFETITNAFEITVEASGLRTIQPAIYKEFLSISYPNYLMNAPCFCKLLTELGITKDDAIFIFRAADFTNRKFLSFRDLLCVLSILEPTTNHGGVTGEVRCRYIFRFFDRDRDGVINYNELREMVIYMRKSKGLPVDVSNVDKELKAYSASLNITPSKSIGLSDFLRFAGELKIRGLSQILRFPKSIKVYMQNSLTKDSKSSLKIISMETPPKTKVDAAYAKAGDFEIAAHSIRISKSGTMINIEDIWSVREIASMTTLQQANITREMRRMSCDINSQESVCNDLIKNLRYLAVLNKAKSGNRGNKRDQYVWGIVSHITYAQKLIQICNMIRNLLKSEPRLLDVRSPLYILGDFHGNFGDLQYFERMFWPLCPGFCPCSLLFLGDYVDRGPFGVEVVTYLFCYKILFPHKINLVRGNHEIREIQKAFTFMSECTSKFGEKLGLEVWENINSVFDVMPIAAVVDGKIFCCHGGIPPPWLCPIATAINNIPSPLSEPDVQSSLAWEIMWNDPIKEKLITPEIDIELKINEGFAMNLKRGTAHMFSSDGLERFLNINGFSHVVRAHEMAHCGYNVLLKGKLMTIFSSSRYNGQNNEAACILVDNGKLRMMRLDPTFN